MTYIMWVMKDFNVKPSVVFYWRILSRFMLVSVLGCSCSMMKPMRYGVAVINEGSTKILVEPFVIVEGPHGTVAVGEVNPGKMAGMSPFYRSPIEIVTISWRVPNTGANGQAQVKPELPKEFTKKTGSSILLHIHPDEQRIEIFYEILDPQTGQTRVIGPGFE